jgi:hypothetical protein
MAYSTYKIIFILIKKTLLNLFISKWENGEKIVVKLWKKKIVGCCYIDNKIIKFDFKRFHSTRRVQWLLFFKAGDMLGRSSLHICSYLLYFKKIFNIRFFIKKIIFFLILSFNNKLILNYFLFFIYN